MGIITQTLRVTGMHCGTCENNVERALKRLRGVRKAKADYGSETVVVTYDELRCNEYQFSEALKLKGYKCSTLPKPRPWRDGMVKLSRIIFGLLGIIAIFYAGSKIPTTESLPGLGQQASVGLLFIVGLLTSFHCVGMCGGFIVGYTARDAMGGKYSYALAHIAYGFGKTISYTAIGAVFGFAGSLISFTPSMKGGAAIAAGIFLVVFGLNMLHLLPHLRLFGIPMPRWLSRFVHSGFRKHKHPLIIGMLNGLMIACGPLQAMYVMAAGTGSPWEGARILLIFGLGTLPLLLGFGFLTSLISHHASDRILKVSGLIVVTLGLIMFNRGMILTGTGYDFQSVSMLISHKLENLEDSRLSKITDEGNSITLHMDVTQDGYHPSRFVIRRGKPVRWVIDVKELTECNRTIVVPKLDLEFELHLGEQTIEFTPDHAGIILWSCGMGMHRGEFESLDDTNSDQGNAKVPSQDKPKDLAK